MGTDAVPENSVLFTDYFLLLSWILKQQAINNVQEASNWTNKWASSQ